MLASGPSEPVPAGAPDRGGAIAAATAETAFGPAEIIAILREVNPRLSAGELRRIAAAISTNSAKYDLDPQLVTAVMWEESHAKPWVRSPKGAIGLMQVMPYMSNQAEIAGNMTNIENNIEVGCLILSDNIRRLGVEDGISAYFWGSNIRGVSYLRRVLDKHESVQRLSQELHASVAPLPNL
jgi:soluble lytic murein transglycosylase-like protein